MEDKHNNASWYIGVKELHTATQKEQIQLRVTVRKGSAQNFEEKLCAILHTAFTLHEDRKQTQRSCIF